MFFHATTSRPTPFLLPHRCKVGFMHGLLRPHQPSFCSCAILLPLLLIVYSCIIVSPPLCHMYHPFAVCFSLMYVYCISHVLFHASRNVFTLALNFLHASTFTPFSLICLFMHRPLCSVLFSCILFTPSSLCLFMHFLYPLLCSFFMHPLLRPHRYMFFHASIFAPSSLYLFMHHPLTPSCSILFSCIILSSSLFMHPLLSFFSHILSSLLTPTVLSVNFPSLFFSPCAILMYVIFQSLLH